MTDMLHVACRTVAQERIKICLKICTGVKMPITPSTSRAAVQSVKTEIEGKSPRVPQGYGATNHLRKVSVVERRVLAVSC